MSAGLGFDVRAMLDVGLQVIAIERDPITAAYLRTNAPNATVFEGDSVELIDELLPQLHARCGVRRPRAAQWSQNA
jgi:16S rRNA A1518/A1519 N6-dimethyltransferase RsmA/KsgA/DIM1 with predicted DNA glycosylase/AP lyase activity